MKRAVLVVLGVAVVAMVAIHVPMLLGSHGGAGTCPFGYGRGDVAIHHDPRLRGNAVASERPALGFALDTTSRGDVTRWAMLHGSWCVDHRGTLECDRVAQPGSLALTSAWFRFNDRGTLDSVRTVRRTSDVHAVATAFADALARQAGTPMMRTGETDDLAAGALRQAAAEYRFTNYRAVLRATNMGNGYALTEEYATLVD